MDVVFEVSLALIWLLFYGIQGLVCEANLVPLLVLVASFLACENK